MNTINRLRRLTGDQSTKKIQTEKISELRRRIEAIMSRRPEAITTHSSRQYYEQTRGGKLSDIIQGEELENEHGKFFVSHTSHSGSSYHGRRSIKEISALDMNTAALLANRPDISLLRCSDALFLDTETTGLSGGTGTLAFLIGIGWFDKDSFVTKQIFVRDFSEERASLKFLTDIVRKKRFLVTFNGKAFDVGLLSTRFILNRLPDPLAGLPHLDLIYPSRRLLGHRLENTRLISLEREILEYFRDADLPASEIPLRYFHWLRKRDPRLMVEVFEHNRLDVVSMGALTVHLIEMTKIDPRNNMIAHHDLFAVARFLLDRGCHIEAKNLLYSLINSQNHTIAQESCKMLSLIHKRHGHWKEAATIWEAMLKRDPGNVFAVEEMAKWCEHREHNFNRAIDIVSGALNSHKLKEEEKDSLSRRLLRLKSRVKRTSPE